jgi:hypothetical protein
MVAPLLMVDKTDPPHATKGSRAERAALEADNYRHVRQAIERRGLRDFLNWLCHVRGLGDHRQVAPCWTIVDDDERVGPDDYWRPVGVGPGVRDVGERLFAAYFDVNLDLVEEHRRNLLGRAPLDAVIQRLQGHADIIDDTGLELGASEVRALLDALGRTRGPSSGPTRSWRPERSGPGSSRLMCLPMPSATPRSWPRSTPPPSGSGRAPMASGTISEDMRAWVEATVPLLDGDTWGAIRTFFADAQGLPDESTITPSFGALAINGSWMTVGQARALLAYVDEIAAGIAAGLTAAQRGLLSALPDEVGGPVGRNFRGRAAVLRSLQALRMVDTDGFRTDWGREVVRVLGGDR